MGIIFVRVPYTTPTSLPPAAPIQFSEPAYFLRDGDTGLFQESAHMFTRRSFPRVIPTILECCLPKFRFVEVSIKKLLKNYLLSFDGTSIWEGLGTIQRRHVTEWVADERRNLTLSLPSPRQKTACDER